VEVGGGLDFGYDEGGQVRGFKLCA
jgi:hypothetical protein